MTIVRGVRGAKPPGEAGGLGRPLGPLCRRAPIVFFRRGASRHEGGEGGREGGKEGGREVFGGRDVSHLFRNKDTPLGLEF